MNYFDQTMEHIWEVQRNLMRIASELEIRGKHHDESKLEEPEASEFEKITHELKNSTYGSPEYKAFLEKLEPALRHHYENNRHHPEFYGENGISGMNLIDIIEMFCDWLAATKRHKDGNIFKSIEINTKRFNLSSQLQNIFVNTAVDVFGEKK